MTIGAMTIRINVDHHHSGATTISLHGWIEGEDESDELLRVVRDARSPVELDLTELRTSNPSGLTALTALASEGVRLTRASDFIKLQLESSGYSLPVSAGESNGGVR